MRDRPAARADLPHPSAAFLTMCFHGFPTDFSP
jgi:hypothetical protein